MFHHHCSDRELTCREVALRKQRVDGRSAGVGGMPQLQGIASRFEAWLAKHADMPGASFLTRMVPYAIKTFGFEPDAFVHELVDSIIGDNYPVPDRMLVHNERIVHEYLMWAVCGKPRPAGKFDLYAVEGGTAAMCYIFKSMKANRLLHSGDTIALGTPIFTPYLELPHLETTGCTSLPSKPAREPLSVYGHGAEEAGRSPGQGVLSRQSRKSNGRRSEQRSHRQDREFGKDERPDLMILTDDVYGTFVHDSDLCSASYRTTLSASTRIPSMSAVPGGASASSRSTKRIFSTR